jgi:hypothetical protein
MKRLITILVFVLLGSTMVFAQNTLQWAKRMGGFTDDVGKSIAIDAFANVFTIGHFTGTVDFDPGTGTYNLTAAGSNGSADIFISKFDDSGNFVWVKQMGGTNTDLGYSIAIDASGNIYTAGIFWYTADFDPGPATYNLTAAGDFDIFISKLSASGSFVWAKQIGGTHEESPNSIALDASGNVYTTGEFQYTCDFDPGNGIYNLTASGSDGYDDIFISKLDVNGNFVWAKRIGGINNDYSHSIALDDLGDIYTIGTFKGNVDFNPGTGIYNLTSTGEGGDTYILKLDMNGNFVWAKQISGIGIGTNGQAISLDVSGNVYVTGWFMGTADFDPGAGTYNLTSIGARDIFISKLNTSGNFVWAKQIGGTGQGYALSIAIDALGNVLTTGSLYGTADFDPGTGTYNLTSVGGNDIFISELNASGNFVWAIRIGTSGNLEDHWGYSITTDASGSVYTTGKFNGTPDFDPGIGTFNLTSAGGNDIFVVKFGCSVPEQPGMITGATTPCQGTSINYFIPNIAGITYTWAFPTGWIQTGGGTTSAVTVTVGSGSGNVTVTPSNECGTGTAQSLAVTPTNVPAQPSFITGSTTPCQGTSENYSVTMVSGVIYSWAFPAGWIQTGGGTTNAVSVTVGNGLGNIIVAPSNACGTGTARTLAVIASVIPVQPSLISGTTTPCQGTSANYSVTMVSGVTYLWAFPAGWIQNGGGNTNAIIVTVGSGSGNISVTPSNECGVGEAQSLAVMPIGLPLQPSAISGATSPCQGSSQNYSVTVEEGVIYSWSLPIGWIQTGGSTTNAIIVTVGGGAGNITVIPSNTCGNGDEQTLAVSPSNVPQQAIVITGTTTPCEGSSESYNVNYETGVTYEWIFPGGWIVTGNSNYEVTVTVGSESGNITVIPINECGIGNMQSLAVMPIDLPLQPSAISGATSPCQGTSAIYSVNEVINVIYTWVLPAGWIQTGGASTHTITVIVGAGSGNISVIPSNACGNGTVKTLAVSPSNIPSQPENITGTTSPCEGTSVNYIVNNVPEVTYTWNFPAGWVQTGGGNTSAVAVTVGAGSGNIGVTPSNACGDGPIVTLAVTSSNPPGQPGVISGPTNPYQGTFANYSVTNVGGVSYSWTFPSGWVQTGGGNTNAVIVKVGSVSGNITVTPSNACGIGTVSILSVTSLIKESASNGSWNLASTWIPQGIPTALQDIVINDNVTIDGALLAVCNNMTITTGGAIEIETGNSLTVSGILTNNVGNAGLSIASGGSLIEATAGIAGTVHREYKAVEKHLISAPVSDATIGMFPGVIIQNHTESTNLYTPLINPTLLLNVMQGYSFQDVNAGTAHFIGNINTGTIGTSNNVSRFGAGINYGWNLVGNPYPSTIDWDAASGWTKTNVDNATYRHVDDATWASYVGGVGSNGGTRYIASCQGFFVTVKAGQTTGTLKMDNNVRTHITTDFFKDEVDNIIRLEVSGNGYTDEMVFRFLDEATPGFDSDWDAHKLFGSVPEAPAIYSSENGMMAINSLPATNTLPFGVKAGTPGVFTITATETSDFSEIILEDMITGITTDLKSSSYTFNYDLNFEDRFIVQTQLASVTQNPLDLIRIYSNNHDIYVYVPANTRGNIMVYTMMGQEVEHTSIKDVVNKITLNKIGYYIVQVLGNDNVVTKKVFVK